MELSSEKPGFISESTKESSRTTTPTYPTPSLNTTTSSTTTTSPDLNTSSSASSATETTAAQRKDTSAESFFERFASCRWILAYMGGMNSLLIMCLRHCVSMAIVCIANVRYFSEVKGNNSGGISHLGYLPNDSRRDLRVYGGDEFGLNGSWVSGYNLSDLRSFSGSSSGVDGLEEKTMFNSTGFNPRERTDVLLISPDYIPTDMQGLVLSSYYYGYVVTPFFGGIVAERFGSKRVLTVAMTLCAILTVLTPLAIRSNIYLTVAFRIALGLLSGVCAPSMTSIWAFWAPKEEKAKLMTIAFSGSSTGNIVANAVSGFLCGISVDEGWPFIFYTYGVASFVWVILWQALVYDTPESHPRITVKERELVLERRASVTTSRKGPKLPLKSVLTSPAFVSLLLTHISYGWFLLVIATYLPLYLNDVWHYDPKTNGLLSSLPFLCQLLSSAVFAVLSDCLTSRHLLSVTCSRKLFQSVGLVLPGVVLVITGWLTPGQHDLAVTLMVVVATLQSACLSGFKINHLDIAPRYSGSLSGITTSVAAAICIVIPLVVSPLIADKRQESWRTVFIITAAVSVFGAVVFAIFGSGEEQDWARVQPPSSLRISVQNGGASASASTSDSAAVEMYMDTREDGEKLEKENLVSASDEENEQDSEELGNGGLVKRV